MQATSPCTVVFLESAAAMGGVQFSTLYLAQTLDRARWNPIVVCPKEGQLTRACRDAGIETHVIEWPRLWSTSVRVSRTLRLPNPFAWIWNAMVILRAVRLLQSFLQKRSPNVLMTKGLASHFVGGFAARRLRIPCVWHVQDLISERSFGVYRRIFGLAARLPRRIIVDGRAIKDQLPSSIHSRISVVHNGVDTNVFRPGLDGSVARRELGIALDQLVIGHVGRITPWKGQHYLIEAFARIAPEYPNAVLLFVGAPVFDHDGYEQRLRAMAAAFGLKNRIIFAGYRHDLANVFSAMDIFAFTSIEKDTSPLALLSAMASGLPIVAFDIEGVRELIHGDNNLLLTPVHDAHQLAQSLRVMISDEQLRSRLSEAARRSAETNLSLDLHVNRVEDILAHIDFDVAAGGGKCLATKPDSMLAAGNAEG
jgi:glycosyltransferase involved in cell wall biosynthesis